MDKIYQINFFHVVGKQILYFEELDTTTSCFSVCSRLRK